jgi:hypothetical protein
MREKRDRRGRDTRLPRLSDRLVEHTQDAAKPRSTFRSITKGSFSICQSEKQKAASLRIPAEHDHRSAVRFQLRYSFALDSA